MPSSMFYRLLVSLTILLAAWVLTAVTPVADVAAEPPAPIVREK